jgi:outer membrane biosynthesis protein TonB
VGQGEVKDMNITKSLWLGLAIMACSGTVRAGDAEGTLDKDLIRRVVRAHIPEIRECYNAALQADPEARGKVVIDFTIGEEGKVTQAGVASSDMKDAAAPACMANAINGWLFPKPDGGSVKVSYPFVLEPG